MAKFNVITHFIWKYILPASRFATSFRCKSLSSSCWSADL